MREYELMLLIYPDLGEEKISALITKTEEKLKGFGAEISKVDKWGVKRLTHSLQNAPKLTQAFYTVIFFKSEPSLPEKIQAFLKVQEEVVRYGISKAVETPPEKEKVAEKPVVENEAVNVGEIKAVE